MVGCSSRPSSVSHAVFGSGNVIVATGSISGPANARATAYHCVVFHWEPQAEDSLLESHYLVHTAPPTTQRFAESPRDRDALWNDLSVILPRGRVLPLRGVTLEALWELCPPRHGIWIDRDNPSSEPANREQVMTSDAYWPIAEFVKVETMKGDITSLVLGFWVGADSRTSALRIRSESAGVEFALPLSAEQARMLFGPPTCIVEERVSKGW